MRNSGLEEAQAAIKIAERNIKTSDMQSPILQGTTKSRKHRCVWRLTGVSPIAGGNPEEEEGNGRRLALQAPLAVGCLLSPGTSLALDDRASKLSLMV